MSNIMLIVLIIGITGLIITEYVTKKQSKKNKKMHEWKLRF